MVKRRLLLITGMAGSGKTTLSNYLRTRGYTVFTMGDVIRHEVRMRNLPPTSENLGKMAEDIRKTGGKDAVAKKCVPLILGEANMKVVLDGVRGMDEVYVFEEAFDTYLITVHASPSTRYGRLKTRGRGDDPANRQVFRKRDLREFSFGMGEAIALSDYILMNENRIEDLERDFDKLLVRLNKIDADKN